jgi:hypothetical protein
MLKLVLPAAAFAVLAAIAPAQAAINAETFRDGRTADLAALCAVPESDAMGVAARAWCHGFLVGVGQYHGTIAAAEGPRRTLFCLPQRDLTLDDARTAFVGWSGRHPEHGAERAIDGLLRFAAETYPCPKPAAPAARKAK